MFVGELDSKGRIWDGKNFQTIPEEKKNSENNRIFWERMSLRQISISKEYEEFNCHMNGVFKCPRCWRTHYIIDNYDLLCDGCVSITLNTTEEDYHKTRVEIETWNIDRGMFYYNFVSKETKAIRNTIQLRRDVRNLLECKNMYGEYYD